MIAFRHLGEMVLLLVFVSRHGKQGDPGDGRGVERAGHHRASHLFRHHDHVRKGSLNPSVGLRYEHAGPSEFHLFLPEPRIMGGFIVHHPTDKGCRALCVQKLARSITKLFLFIGKIEMHVPLDLERLLRRPVCYFLGRPSARVARMLR